MKKLTILICIIILTACGYETPKLNDIETPFVVDKIKQIDNTHSKYQANNVNAGGGYNLFGSWQCVIILPTGMYNIGDTIIIK